MAELLIICSSNFVFDIGKMEKKRKKKKHERTWKNNGDMFF